MDFHNDYRVATLFKLCHFVTGIHHTMAILTYEHKDRPNCGIASLLKCLIFLAKSEKKVCLTKYLWVKFDYMFNAVFYHNR